MINNDNNIQIYHRQANLLVEVLPHIFKDTEFALRGGTAINFFYRNLPRYSIDIDLTYT
ncbi:MAG: nucleotidyl transferase AbiEii/AbiGii toxin family protein, partial [Candidatus Firestonebacteria bacterium]